MKTPWHLWVFGVVSLLWNFGGAYDYVMVRTGNQAYLDQMLSGAAALFSLAIVVVSILLIVYARRMTAKGVLR